MDFDESDSEFDHAGARRLAEKYAEEVIRLQQEVRRLELELERLEEQLRRAESAAAEKGEVKS